MHSFNFDKTRKASFAGRFYPGNGQKLRKEIKALLQEATPLLYDGTTPQVIIVPHAGYVFSGKVAASGYNQISSGYKPKRVFVLASSHQMQFAGASVYCSGNYETPLGKVVVDMAAGKKLISECSLFSPREDAHLFEHSLEVQLPFLQAAFNNDFELVPIIIGTNDPEECQIMANALQKFLTKENLFVISTDFSHYPDYESATKNDWVTSEAICSNSPKKLLKTLKKNKKSGIPGLVTSLCGWTSVLTALFMTCEQPIVYEWIDYQNSGDQPLYGDQSRVVGYSAITAYYEEQNEGRLLIAEKKQLLEIAKNAVESAIIAGKSRPVLSAGLTQKLTEPGGAFVSLYVSGQLRGCMGSFATTNSLADTVSQSAFSACADQRFQPPTPEEIEGLLIEISVLTPLRMVKSASDIEPGKHGILIKKGLNRGTFLPQVAQKQGWDAEEFLGRCSRDKAGLGWDGWKNAELYTYEAIIFRGIVNSQTRNA